MLTKNFKALLQTACLSTSYRRKGFIQAKSIEGDDVYLSRSNTTGGWPGSWPISPMIDTTNRQGICFGSGNTPASENDYSLESRITEGLRGVLSLDADNRSLDENGVLQDYMLITLTNTSNEIQTISEIGMTASAYATKSFNYGSDSGYIFLIDRTVLTTPLILAPNESGLITYIFKLDS